MADGFINAEGVRQRRMPVPDREAQFTWLGDEDPDEEFLETMQALVDAVTRSEGWCPEHGCLCEWGCEIECFMQDTPYKSPTAQEPSE